MDIPAIFDYLNEEFPFFTTLIVNIGKPVLDRNIPTAEVRKRVGDTDFQFAVNPNYFDTLPLEQQAGAFAHEAVHILLRHLEEQADPYFSDKQRFTIATECRTNDFVLNEGFDLPPGLIYGADRLGEDTSHWPTKEIYDLLPETPADQQQGDGSDGQADDASGHYTLTAEQGKELFDKVMEAASYSPFQNSDQMKKLMDEVSGKKAGFAGSTAQMWARKNRAKMEWVKLLKKLDPDFLEGSLLFGGTRGSWHEPRRKLAYMYPKVNLPSRKNTRKGVGGRQKPKILLALDQSGSIPAELAETMRELARSIPDTIAVDCCTFSTFSHKFDYKRDDNEIATGGTDFSAIEQFARANSHDGYPMSIVVITDGEANFNSVAPTAGQLNENWHWVMTPGSSRPHCDGYNADQVYMLENFVDKSLVH